MGWGRETLLEFLVLVFWGVFFNPNAKILTKTTAFTAAHEGRCRTPGVFRPAVSNEDNETNEGQ